jgi:hypothetical protein
MGINTTTANPPIPQGVARVAINDRSLHLPRLKPNHSIRAITQNTKPHFTQPYSSFEKF